MELEIECGFNTNDETINFGNRGMADNDPYESVTFATLKTDFEDSSTPLIIPKLYENQLFTSVNNILVVFQDEEFGTLKFSSKLDVTIDDYIYSNKLLFLFLRNGSLQVFRDTSGSFNSVMIKQIVEQGKLTADKTFVNSFYLEAEQDTISLLTVTSHGQIFQVNILEKSDSEVSVRLELIQEIDGTVDLTAYNDGILFLHGSEMWIYDLFSKNIISSNALDIKFATFSGTMILSLLGSGQLSYICPVTLLHFIRDIDYPLESIYLIHDESGNVKYINGVSKTETDKKFQLYMFRSDFSLVYTLPVHYDTVLINSCTVVQETRYITLELKKDGSVELHFKCVIETDIQKRLNRLLRRNMFDEAEQFAITHKLDINIVSKEKAKVIAEKWRITKQDIDTLMNTFHTIEDQSFILDCCMMVENTCEQAEDLLRILNFACNLQVPKVDEVSRKKQYYCNRLLIKFNLFRLIKDSDDMEGWNFFCDENLTEEVKKLLKEQKLCQAISLYQYLTQSEAEILNEACIHEMLDIINDADLYILQDILPRFISITLEWLPSCLPLFVDWLEIKIFQMEKLHNDDFPEIAIDFLEATADCLKLKYIGENLETNKNNSSQKVQTLLKKLNELHILKSEYGVRITFNDMKQEPEIVVRTLLNSDLAKDVYNSLLQEFIYKYILENNLNPDELFYDVIIDILKYQESYWSTVIGSVLSCITSHDLKLQAVENMYTRAKLPWSDAIKQIGIQILKECYPKSGNVQQLMADEPRMTVMSRIEYGFGVINSSNVDDLQLLVRRIIRCNLPTMISDALVISQDKVDYKIDTMRLLFHHFIRAGDFDNSFKLLEEDDVIVKNGLERILVDANRGINLMTSPETENYAYFLNSSKVLEKYKSLCDNEYDSHRWIRRAKAFLAANNIKCHFNVNSTGTELSNPKQKIDITNKIRSDILYDFEKGKNIAEVMKSLKVLASDIGMKKEKLYSQCWEHVKVNKNEFLCRVAEEFLTQSVEVKYICVLVVYLLRNLTNEDEGLFAENSFIDSFTTNVIDNFSDKLLQLSSLLISKAIWNAESTELQACLKIVPWVDSIYFLNRNMEQEKNISLENSNNVRQFIPTFTCRLAIQKVFSIYTSYIAQFKDTDYKFLSYYNRDEESITQESFLLKIKEFETALYILNQEGESLLAYKLLTTLQNNLSSLEDGHLQITETLNEMIRKHIIPHLVQLSIHEEDIDKNLLHTALMWCNPKETEKFIVRTMQHNRKVIPKVTTISKIAVKMFRYHEINELHEYFKNVLLNVSWWERINHSNIDHDLFFRASNEERLKLIIQSEELDIKLIKEYCEEYGLADVQLFYLFYLRTFLLNWKPKYEIETSNIGRKKLIMKGNQQKELHQKCNDILSHIEYGKKLENTLEEIWSQVNFYYYEVFTCILSCYRYDSFNHVKLMLGFLESYQRINKPSDMEIEKWFNTFPDSEVIDPLSEFRILFNNTLLESKDIWDIICKEITLENYTAWFEAVQAFRFLNVDNICSFLAKEIIAQDILKVIKPGDWIVAKHTNLFTEIDNCLDYMKDDVKKTTAAYMLLSNTPEGADQVTIAKIAHKYAEDHKLKSPESSQLSFSKIEKKYQRCLSLQILHQHDLAEQKYIDLIGNIEGLLLALHHDDRIIQKMGGFCPYCPDINTAVGKLAKVFAFDISKFRKTMVENYLMDFSHTDFGDVSFEPLVRFNSNEKTDKERSKNNLKRAAYICSSDIYYWHQYLWNLGCKSDKSDFYRSRCVKCLFMFLDPIGIRALCDQSYESVVDIRNELTISSILSKFGLQLNLNDINTWNNVTKKLARIGSKESVLSLAQVCKILKIKKLRYWEFIITNMDRHKMHWEMIEFLEYTKKEDYIYEKFYIQSWSNLIDFLVNDIIDSSTLETDSRIINTLNIIQACPVILLLNLEANWKKCMQSNKHKMAEILMKYIPK